LEWLLCIADYAALLANFSSLCEEVLQAPIKVALGTLVVLAVKQKFQTFEVQVQCFSVASRQTIKFNLFVVERGSLITQSHRGSINTSFQASYNIGFIIHFRKRVVFIITPLVRMKEQSVSLVFRGWGFRGLHLGG